MSLGYDTECSTLSQEGKIYQVDYATKAVEDSSSVLGLVCANGVILMREKILHSNTQVKGSNKAVYTVNESIGMTFGGLFPDGRALVSRAKGDSASYLKVYGVPIDGRQLSERVALEVAKNTMVWYMRPYASATLFSSYDKMSGFHLYMIETNGNVQEYYACAHGKGRVAIKTELEMNGFAISKLNSLEAVVDALAILIKSYEGQELIEYDISIISEDTGYKQKVLSYAEVEQVRAQANIKIKEQENQMNIG